MYAPHENTILNANFQQLQDIDEPNKGELQGFIKSISHSTRNSVDEWRSGRDTKDLCDLVKNYYYDPYMGGSNTIIAALPAILNSSA